MAKSNPLSRTAQAVLTDAAARDDHLAFPPEHLLAAAKRAVVQSLLRAGLLEEIAAADDGAAWRTTETSKCLALRATAAGLAAIECTTARDGSADSDHQVGKSAPVSASNDQPAAEQAPTTSTDTAGVAAQITRLGLRAAAEAVLMTWDDPDRNRPALPDAMEALRAALLPRSMSRTRTALGDHYQPRPDTKRAAVLALLRRPEGTTVAQVADATGWASHTVRGFFAGLKKAGTPVDMLERVRQVGPGKEGTKGSYTVYRVAEAG